MKIQAVRGQFESNYRVFDKHNPDQTLMVSNDIVRIADFAYSRGYEGVDVTSGAMSYIIRQS